MSTHMSGFQSFLGFLHLFVLVKLATTSIMVNDQHTLFMAYEVLVLLSGKILFANVVYMYLAILQLSRILKICDDNDQ